MLITSVNEYGQQLLDLWTETKLKILNDRTHGDLQGHLDICRLLWLQYSRFSFNIRNISDKVNYSTVFFSSSFEFLSDLWPILLKLIRNYNFLPNKIIKDTQVCELKHKPTRYTWKNSFGKDFALRVSLETNKISKVPLDNGSDTNFRSEIEYTLG